MSAASVMIADKDVVANKPEQCEQCGAVVMRVLVNDANATRRWESTTWNSTAKAWAVHVCAERAEL